MKKTLLILLVGASLVLTACGKKQAETVAEEEPVIMEETASEEESPEEAVENNEEDNKEDEYFEIANKIVDYFTECYSPEGEYVIFDTENVETEDTVSFIVRYRPSEKEEEEMIEDGTGPLANIYVTTVVYTKATGDLIDENGLDLNEEVTEPVDEVSEHENQMDLSSLAGEYQDSVSKRAMMTLTESENGDTINIEVQWGSSAWESTEWTMTASLNADTEKFEYTDCKRAEVLYADDGTSSETVVYENEAGYFEWNGDTKELAWTGATDDNCKECVFVKFE